MAILFSKSSGVNNAQVGRLETPIKMVIEHESDLQTKQGGIRDWLFNVERSPKTMTCRRRTASSSSISSS